MSEEFLFSRTILTEDECQTIGKSILKNENLIKSLGPDLYAGTKSDSLTGRFRYYNFLNDDEIGPILIPKLKKIFKELELKYPISVQCWGNIFRKGEGIKVHKHGPLNESFLCANLFISGPTKPGTTYYLNNQFVNFENKVGEIHVFGSNLYHYVSDNKSEEIRISLALDILPEKSYNDGIRHYVFEQSKSKGFKNK